MQLQMMHCGAERWMAAVHRRSRPDAALILLLRSALTLPKYKERAARDGEYDRWAIHTLASQTADGALTLGDSHEYGLAVDIFNKTEIDELVLRDLRRYLVAPDLSIAERWYGVYAKHPDKPYVAMDAAPGVRIVTAVGGSGMTLSFGLAEQMIREMAI